MGQRHPNLMYSDLHCYYFDCSMYTLPKNVEHVSGVDCGILIAPKNGDIDFSLGTSYGSVATYSCVPPFQLDGSPTRVCLNNGQWSGVAPSCECKLVETFVCLLADFVRHWEAFTCAVNIYDTRIKTQLTVIVGRIIAITIH